MNNLDNNDRPERNLQSIQEKICNYILSNLLSVLSATSLLVGGFIFWLYFFNIQYFPNLSFNESVLFLLVAAITGIITLLFLAFLFMTPYFPRWKIMREKQKKTFYPTESKIFALTVTGSDGLSNKYKAEITSNKKENDSYNERVWYFASVFIIPSLLTFPYLFIIIPVLVILQFCFYWKQEPRNMEIFGAWIASAMMTLLILFFMFKMVEKLEGVFIFLFLMCGNIWLADNQEAERPKKIWYLFIPIAIVLVTYLLIVPSFPKFVMSTYKFGNFETQQLLVDEEGCKILKHLELIPDNDQNKITCHLKNAEILSRLGYSFYIKTTGNLPLFCGQPLLFTIPGKHVLSWSINP